MGSCPRARKHSRECVFSCPQCTSDNWPSSPAALPLRSTSATCQKHYCSACGFRQWYYFSIQLFFVVKRLKYLRLNAYQMTSCSIGSTCSINNVEYHDIPFSLLVTIFARFTRQHFCKYSLGSTSVPLTSAMRSIRPMLFKWLDLLQSSFAAFFKAARCF